MKVPENLIPYLQEMLYDLKGNNLVVEKAKDTSEKRERNGCGIRAVRYRNISWYRELCEQNPKPPYRVDAKVKKRIKRKFRAKPQTNLKKNDIINILNWMIQNKKSKSQHADFLLHTAKKYKKWYETIPENDDRELIAEVFS